MSRRTHTPDERAAAIADFRDSGDTIAQVAARHGVARSTLGNWTAGLRDEIGLSGGQWILLGGIKRWEPTHRQVPVRISVAERRKLTEEALFTEAEAREAHASFFAGARDERTVMGERVYQRRQKREQRARKVAA